MNFLLEKYKGDKIKAADEFGCGIHRRRFITTIRKMDYERLIYRDSNDLLRNEEYRKEITKRKIGTSCICKDIGIYNKK